MLQRQLHNGADPQSHFVKFNSDFEINTGDDVQKEASAVELFFKWIKRHLRIKAFYGYSENAVKTQIWIAVPVYVLVAIRKKRLAPEAGLREILPALRVTLFE